MFTEADPVRVHVTINTTDRGLVPQSSLESQYQKVGQEYDSFIARSDDTSQGPVAKETQGWLRDRFPFYGFHHVLRGADREWATVPYHHVTTDSSDSGNTAPGGSESSHSINRDQIRKTDSALGFPNPTPLTDLNRGLSVGEMVQTTQQSPPAHVFMSTTPSGSDKSDLTLHIPSSDFRSEEDAVRLFELLNNDLGIANVAVVFDGQGGYILHSTGSHTPKLSVEAREGIIDYVTGKILPKDVIGCEHVSIPGTDRVEYRRTLVPTGYGEQVIDSMESYSTLIDDGRMKDVERDFLSLPTVSPHTAQEATKMIRDDNGEFARGIADDTLPTYKVTMGIIRDVISDRSVDPTVVDTPFIPAPGTINAATGRRVMRVNPADIDTGSFDPVEDTIVEFGE